MKGNLTDLTSTRLHSMTRREFLRVAVLLSAAVFVASCVSPGQEFADRETEIIRRLLILYTNDEHGWMDPWEQADGAAGMFHLWRTREGYDPAGPFLVLSGGDMWTGPALSTWFEGESMIAVMNAMGYQAAAIGNHDFDYGLDSLRLRSEQADFPFLSANVRSKDGGGVPDFAQPFTILKVNGINVGLVGMTTVETPIDTQPAHVQDFYFLPYEQALREVFPQVKSAGADLILVLGHICTSEMESLAPAAAELGIPIIFGGHCHEETNALASGVTLVQSGSFMRNYVRIALLFDTVSKQVVEINSSLQRNQGQGFDEEVQTLIADWRQQSDPELWQPIGFVREKIDSESPEVAALLTKSWLAAYPQGQIALASPRYVQSIPTGEVTRATVISTLPTENTLVDVELTGAQITSIIAANRPILGGITAAGDGYRFEDGSPLRADATYHVLMPDVLVEGGNYYTVKDYQPTVHATGIDWKAPVIDWIASLHTDSSDPLEDHLRE